MTARKLDIQIQTSEGAFSAYLSAPEVTNGVAIVLLQEIFGVNQNIRSIADGLAEGGYAVVAPDLFWRVAPGIQLDPATGQGREQAVELMKQLDRDQAVSDGNAALAALHDTLIGLERSVALGYCFGGGVAFLMAARGCVDAGVAYYGTGLQDLLSELRGDEPRMLLHIAGEDHLCPPEAQRQIQQAAAAVGEAVEVVVHPGVGHAFARRGGAAYDQSAAQRADARTAELLASMIPA